MINIDFKQITTLLVAYCAFISVLYLFGYWGSFDINILEYASLSDIVKMTAYPLLMSFIALAIGIVTVELSRGDGLPVGGGNDTYIAKLGFKYAKRIVATALLLSVLLIHFGTEPIYWLYGSMILIFTISTALQSTTLAKRYAPNSFIMYAVLGVAIMLPIMSYYNGKNNAFLIKHGKDGNVIDINKSTLNIQTTNDSRQFMLLGFVSDVYFIYDTKSKQTIFLKQKDNVRVVLSSAKNNDVIYKKPN